ncbi:MAG: ScyD/ScyE family protein [Chloroflexi bacterium]|nr:ScyD/ScyE family protein [Chloroflexota bacterium]
MKSQRTLRTALFVLLAISTVLFTGAALAQDMPPLPGELIVGDLSAPRAIAFDDEGNLLVAVAGSGGEVTMTMASPEGESEMSIGMTGKIISVAPDGTVTDVIGAMPSYAAPMETMGVYRAIPHGDSLWVLYSGGGPATTGAFWQDSIVELDPATLAVKHIINMNPIETELDPDGNGYDSNVADIAWTADGALLIVDAGSNALFSWTAEGGIEVVAAWPSNDVPTSVEVADNGDIYVGFLGAGIAPGAGKVERWSNGELAETFGGLTAVTDVLVDGETVYAVEMFLFGEQGPGPGDVLMLSADGNTVVAGGLIAPFGLAKGPDGSIYVSFGTVAFAPGMTGGVVKLAPAM